MLDPAGDEIVERRLGIGGSRRQASAGVSQKFDFVGQVRPAVFAEQPHHQFAIDVRRINILERRRIALFSNGRSESL